MSLACKAEVRQDQRGIRPQRTGVGTHGPGQHGVKAVQPQDTEKVAVVDVLGRDWHVLYRALSHVVKGLELQEGQVALRGNGPHLGGDRDVRTTER